MAGRPPTPFPWTGRSGGVCLLGGGVYTTAAREVITRILLTEFAVVVDVLVDGAV